MKNLENCKTISSCEEYIFGKLTKTHTQKENILFIEITVSIAAVKTSSKLFI